MKNKMKKKMPGLLLLFVMIAAVLLPNTVSAETAKSKALAAYKTFLTQKTLNWKDIYGEKVSAAQGGIVSLSSVKFTIAYVNDDTVPELVIHEVKGFPSERRNGQMMLYTYRNGRVTYVKTLRDLGKVSGTFRYFKRKGVFIDNNYKSGVDSITYYRLISGSASAWLSRCTNYASQTASVKIGQTGYYLRCFEKRITYKCYLNQRKKVVGDSGVVKAKFHANTSSNRAAYLK